MSTFKFILPDIGEGLHEAEIVSWLVKPGDQVNENDDIVEVQTDKAVVEISAPVSGVIEKFGGEEGESVKVGETLAVFSGVTDERANGEISEEIEIPDTPSEMPEEMREQRIEKPKERILAAPSVRKAAREAGVNLHDVRPTGKAGKILAADLQSYIENGTAATPTGSPENKAVKSAPLEGESNTEAITGTRKAIFEKMTIAKNNAVMCTGMDDINVSALVKLRKSLIPHAEQKTVKLTYLPFVVKAVSHVLKRFPIFNSSIDEEKMRIRYHDEIHIGIAVASENGLLVPVVRNADKKSVLEIAQEIEELTDKARTKKLKASELSGSTFTISNTGSQGGMFATPIINYPEVAIMGIHKISKQPIVQDEEIVIGHIMGMSLTFDHRIIDGEPSGKFMYAVKELLEKPELLILEGK